MMMTMMMIVFLDPDGSVDAALHRKLTPHTFEAKPCHGSGDFASAHVPFQSLNIKTLCNHFLWFKITMKDNDKDCSSLCPCPPREIF